MPVVFRWPRMAYHSEEVFVGVFRANTGRVVTELSDAARGGLNGRAGTGAITPRTNPSMLEDPTFRFLFPNKMRIEGICSLMYPLNQAGGSGIGDLYGSHPLAPSLRWSADSLTGDDGIFTEVGTIAQADVPLLDPTTPNPGVQFTCFTTDGYVDTWPEYYPFENESYADARVPRHIRKQWTDPLFARTHAIVEGGAIVPMRLRNVQAMELSFSQAVWGNIFLYGEPEPSYFQEGLIISEYDREDPWRPEAAMLGNRPIHSSEDILLRVTNTSPSLSADNILMDVEPTPPYLIDNDEYQYLFSLDGRNFRETVEIGELSPGAVSPIVYLRRVTGVEHPVRVNSALVRATAERWY